MRARQMMPPFTASSANRTYFGFPRTTTCANIYKRWLLGSYTGAPVTPMFGSRSRHDLSARNGDVPRSYAVPTHACPLSPPARPGGGRGGPGGLRRGLARASRAVLGSGPPVAAVHGPARSGPARSSTPGSVVRRRGYHHIWIQAGAGRLSRRDLI